MAFVPAAQRDLAAAWFALLQELTDAAWGSGDPTPGLAKLAWWLEELDGWASGVRRHPLGALLQPQAAPWAMLARSLPALQSSRVRPAEAASLTDIARFADAVAACEAGLFDAAVIDDASTASLVVLHTLEAEHVLHHPDTAAAHRSEGGIQDLAAAATRPRRIHAAIVQARLRQPAAPLSPLRTLLIAWRAARAHQGRSG